MTESQASGYGVGSMRDAHTTMKTVDQLRVMRDVEDMLRELERDFGVTGMSVDRNGRWVWVNDECERVDVNRTLRAEMQREVLREQGQAQNDQGNLFQVHSR